MLQGEMSVFISEKTEERLTPKRNVLSFDCGLKNLAYCLVEDVNTSEKEVAIRLWETFSLTGDSLKECVVSLFRQLKARPWMLLVDHVAIEAQMSTNSQMKMISHVLQMYFLCNRGNNKPSIHFISPKSKFTCTNVPEPAGLAYGHNRNKKIAIEMAKKMLYNNHDQNGLNYMLSHKKQDDLADSYLQGSYFLRTLRRNVKSSILKHLDKLNEEIEPETYSTAVFKADDFVLPSVFNIDGEDVSQGMCFKRVK